MTKFATIGLGRRVDLGEVDQRMARSDRIQTEQSDQDTNGGLTLAKREELRAEIIGNALCCFDVSRSAIIVADLPGADCKFARHWQRDVSKGQRPRESSAPKVKYCP